MWEGCEQPAAAFFAFCHSHTANCVHTELAPAS